MNDVKEPKDTVEKATDESSGDSSGWRIDLLALIPGLRWIVKQRWFQFAVILPNLVFFLFFLVAGVYGSPVGNANIIIIFVWIFWWFMLISLMVPFASRVWCMVCPFPFFGEWAQRGRLIKPIVAEPKSKQKKVGRNRFFGLNLRWPKALSNIWLQNIGFLALCTFSALLLTRPIVSVIVLGGLFVLATIFHLIFRQRAFCNYICPVSGFLSLYSMTSMVEVRSKDAGVCKKCKTKGCLTGNEKGWGCPWMLFPSKLDRNNYCGLCMECMKTCPYDNMTVLARPLCSDSELKGYDEAWKAFIMISLASAYSAIFLGPWGFFKDWANLGQTGGGLIAFVLYAAGLWTLALAVMPSLFAGAVWLGRVLAGSDRPAWKASFLAMVYPLVPLGLFAWIAFSVPLMFINGTYILTVLSDPMGWGWDLFGTATLKWTPILPQWMPHLQTVILSFGLIVSLKKCLQGARRVYADPKRAIMFCAPTAVLLSVLVMLFLALYAG